MTRRAETRSQGAPATGVPRRLIVPIVLGTLLQALNSSMIAVAMVDIGREFGAGSSASWLISGMYLATAVGAPAAGKLADLLGPRRVFLGALSLVVLGSVTAPMAAGIGWLIATRVLLGLGTCAAFPAGVAIIRAEADRIGVSTPAGALGALAVAGQVMVALGPTVGGVLVQWWGWQAIFLVNLPFVAASGALALLWLPADGPRRQTDATPGRAPRIGVVLRRLDVVGMLLFAAAVAMLMLALLSFEQDPQWWLLGVFAVLMTVFVLVELRAAEPFVDLRLLRSNRRLTMTYLRTGLTYIAFYSVFYGLPIWLEQGRGLNSAESGMVMLPVAGVATLITMLVARILPRTGHWPVLLAGSVLFLIAGIALGFVGPLTSVTLLLGLAALLGLPNGFNNLGNQTAMYAAAEARNSGIASGLYRTSQYVAANLSAVVIQLCFGSTAGATGLHEVALVIVVISVVLVIGAIVGVRRARAHS